MFMAPIVGEWTPSRPSAAWPPPSGARTQFRVILACSAAPGGSSLDAEAITARADATRSARRHHYDPSWFGIQSVEVAERFRSYTDRFELA
jgi:hypothetical protein